MSLRVTSGNDLHSSPSETVVTAVIWRRCPRPPGLLDGFLASTGLDLTPFCNPRDPGLPAA
jgi:hypothetical protein